MKIDRNLNLVVSVECADKSIVHVHSMPISVAVFETYFLPISKTFAEIWNGGLGVTSGPRVASLLLRKVAEDLGRQANCRPSDAWDGPTGVENGLMAEIRRLTNVAVPRTGGGWEQLPWEQARSKGIVDAEDAAEVENALVFFTVASRMHRRAEREGMVQVAAGLWGAQTTPLDITAYCNSLTTSTPAASTGPSNNPPVSPPQVQSIPS